VKALEIDPHLIEAEQLLSRINQAIPPRDVPPAIDPAANRGMAIHDTHPRQRKRPQPVTPAEKPLRKVVAEVGQVAEMVLDQVQQPFSAKSSGSQPRSEAPAPVPMAQSNLPAVDLAQAVIDSYADRVLPMVTDLSPPRLPRTDRWINVLWMIMILGFLGFLIFLVFHGGNSRNNPSALTTVAGTRDVQTSNGSLQGNQNSGENIHSQTKE
jgi:hypothetical protein